MTRVVKSAHAATDKAEQNFEATEIYSYRTNIASDEEFAPSETTHKVKMLDEKLEGTEDGYSNADPPLRVHGQDLPTPVSLRTPDNVATVRKYCSHKHGSNKPIPKSFCGLKTMQDKFSGVRNFVLNTLQNVC